jgi:Family of unknown function (DUF5335)
MQPPRAVGSRDRYIPHWQRRLGWTVLMAQVSETKAMTERRLARSEWKSYCDRISKQLEGNRAELEIVGLDLGDRVEARWRPLLGVVYDAHADVLEIALEGIDHMIDGPRELVVEETPRGLVTIEVIAADERRQILKLRNPLPLTPAA